jgi:hypothetical protein
MTGEQMTPEELAATLEQTATWMATRPAGVTWTGDGLDGTVAGLRDAAKSIRKQLSPAWDALTAERDSLREALEAPRTAVQAGDARMVLPPPGAVVSAAYLTHGTDGPKVILEVCPHCTARTGDDSRMCLCRVKCTYAGCRHDDPMTLLVTGGDAAGGGGDA